MGLGRAADINSGQTLPRAGSARPASGEELPFLLAALPPSLPLPRHPQGGQELDNTADCWLGGPSSTMGTTKSEEYLFEVRICIVCGL